MYANVFLFVLIVGSCFLQCLANHPCCANSSTAPDSSCNMAACNTALSSANHPALVMFLDGCRQELGRGYDFVRNVMSCFAPHLNRRAYLSLLSTEPEAQMEGNYAALVFGYGCVNEARTAGCSSLDSLYPTDAIYGIEARPVPAGQSGAISANLSLNGIIKECIGAELKNFKASEWNGGMSQCATAGTDKNPASLSSFIPPERASATCEPCSPVNELPFCENFYSEATAVKYGTWCSAGKVSDRVAQSFHSQWVRNNAVKLGNDSVPIRNSAICRNYLKEIACHTILGPCSAEKTPVTLCQAHCVLRLTDNCGMSRQDATSSCAAIQATSTAETCPAIPSDPTQETPTESPPMLANSTTLQNTFKVRACFTTTQAPSENHLQTVLQGVLSGTCGNNFRSTRCTLVDYVLFRNAGNATCPVSVEAEIRTGTTSVSETDLSQHVAREVTGLPASQLTVSKASIPVPVLARATSDSGSSQAKAVSWFLGFATMVALVVQ